MSNFETRWEREGQEFLAYCTEQAEQKPVAVVEITYGREPECYVTGSIDDFPEGVFKLYAAPVPITTPDVCGEVCVRAKLCYGCGKALDEANAKFTEQAEQEPVAWIKLNEDGVYIEDVTGFPVYAAPVQQVDLTDDEIERALDAAKVPELPDGYKSVDLEIARAVIAADREKNK